MKYNHVLTYLRAKRFYVNMFCAARVRVIQKTDKSYATYISLKSLNCFSFLYVFCIYKKKLCC